MGRMFLEGITKRDLVSALPSRSYRYRLIFILEPFC